MSTYKRLLYEAIQARDMYGQCAQFSTHTEHCLGTCFQNIMTPGLHLCLPCLITASFPRCRVIPLALFSHGVIHFLPIPPVSYGVVDRSAERLWPWDLGYGSSPFGASCANWSAVSEILLGTSVPIYPPWPFWLQKPEKWLLLFWSLVPTIVIIVSAWGLRSLCCLPGFLLSPENTSRDYQSQMGLSLAIIT